MEQACTSRTEGGVATGAPREHMAPSRDTTDGPPTTGAPREHMAPSRDTTGGPSRAAETTRGVSPERSRGEVDRRKIKEADKIEVPPFPEITKLLSWKTNLQRQVVTASGNPDYSMVASWIAAAWTGKTYEELDDPGGSLFVMLDMKLANCMVAMMNKAGERGKRFRDRVNLRMEEAARKGDNVIKGRQIVWMLLDSFKTFDNSELAFGFDHLSKLKVQNGDLHEFLIQWNHVLDNMGGVELTHGALRDVLYRKIKEEDELKYDINLYERMHEGDPKKTYKHLMSCVESVIKLQDQRKNISGEGGIALCQEAERGSLCASRRSPI